MNFHTPTPLLGVGGVVWRGKSGEVRCGNGRGQWSGEWHERRALVGPAAVSPPRRRNATPWGVCKSFTLLGSATARGHGCVNITENIREVTNQ